MDAAGEVIEMLRPGQGGDFAPDLAGPMIGVAKARIYRLAKQISRKTRL